jgi:small multidrug resistance pump/quaternary ammonium compound-resistance protein SugE
MDLLLLVTASVFFACGGLCMKYSQGLTKLEPTIGVFALFGIGATCQAVAMRRTDMGVAYIFVLGLEAVIAFFLSVGVLGEKFTFARVGALVLIVSGIVWLQRP